MDGLAEASLTTTQHPETHSEPHILQIILPNLYFSPLIFLPESVDMHLDHHLLFRKNTTVKWWSLKLLPQ